MGTRIKEHQASVRLQKTERSALCEHALNCGHLIAWQDAKILESEGRWHQRKWAEACYISKNKNAIFNRDSGRKLPENYIPLLNCKEYNSRTQPALVVAIVSARG